MNDAAPATARKSALPAISEPLTRALVHHLAAQPLPEIESIAYQFLPRGLQSLRAGKALSAEAFAPFPSASSVSNKGDSPRSPERPTRTARQDPFIEIERRLIEFDRFLPPDQQVGPGFHDAADRMEWVWFRKGTGLVGLSFRKRSAGAGGSKRSVDGNIVERTQERVVWSRAFHAFALRLGTFTESAGLSDRDCEVLGILAQGETIRGIAEDLGTSPDRISLQLSRIRHKLRVRTNIEAVADAMALGALDFS